MMHVWGSRGAGGVFVRTGLGLGPCSSLEGRRFGMGSGPQGSWEPPPRAHLPSFSPCPSSARIRLPLLLGSSTAVCTGVRQVCRGRWLGCMGRCCMRGGAAGGAGGHMRLSRQGPCLAITRPPCTSPSTPGAPPMPPRIPPPPPRPTPVAPHATPPRPRCTHQRPQLPPRGVCLICTAGQQLTQHMPDLRAQQHPGAQAVWGHTQQQAATGALGR